MSGRERAEDFFPSLPVLVAVAESPQVPDGHTVALSRGTLPPTLRSAPSLERRGGGLQLLLISGSPRHSHWASELSHHLDVRHPLRYISSVLRGASLSRPGWTGTRWIKFLHIFLLLFWMLRVTLNWTCLGVSQGTCGEHTRSGPTRPHGTEPGRGVRPRHAACRRAPGAREPSRLHR